MNIKTFIETQCVFMEIKYAILRNLYNLEYIFVLTHIAFDPTYTEMIKRADKLIFKLSMLGSVIRRITISLGRPSFLLKPQRHLCVESG